MNYSFPVSINNLPTAPFLIAYLHSSAVNIATVVISARSCHCTTDDSNDQYYTHHGYDTLVSFQGGFLFSIVELQLWSGQAVNVFLDNWIVMDDHIVYIVFVINWLGRTSIDVRLAIYGRLRFSICTVWNSLSDPWIIHVKKLSLVEFVFGHILRVRSEFRFEITAGLSVGSLVVEDRLAVSYLGRACIKIILRIFYSTLQRMHYNLWLELHPRLPAPWLAFGRRLPWLIFRSVKVRLLSVTKMNLNSFMVNPVIARVRLP